MPTRNIKLTEHFARFVEEQVDAGKFRDESDVMSAGLRLLEQQTREHQEKLSLLRLLAGKAFDQIDQGNGIQIDGERQLAAFIGRIGRRAAAKVKNHRRPE